MKIVDKRFLARANFEDMKEGDVFCWDKGCYMKIEDVIEEILAMKSNAINLYDGTLAYFSDNTNVTRVNCELVIK